ncbi:hypothetical protein ACP70R_024718 [Stipagrostis hirtigluma subsp. patula]
MDHGDRRSGAAGRPWRGGGGGGAAPPQPPPKVYSVEPRDFRELVQRLTGAGAAGPAAPAAVGARQRATTTQAAAAAAAAAGGEYGRTEAAAAEQFDYASWFSAPLLSPAYAPAGFHGHHGNGVL